MANAQSPRPQAVERESGSWTLVDKQEGARKKRRIKQADQTTGLSGHQPKHNATSVQCRSTKQRLINVPSWNLLDPNFRQHLATFRTEGCVGFGLQTERLVLRPCRPEDLPGVQKIKTEPIVQKTQLYGSPSNDDCRDAFLNRYIRSSMPRLSVSKPMQCRDEYVFAITLKDPPSVVLQPPGQIKMTSRLTSAEGYVGNIALSLDPRKRSYHLYPRPGRVFTHPTLTHTKEAQLTGNMFYELHPQLWGCGLMSEAFGEVLRFAIEEVGCTAIICNPMTTNRASIKLCEKNGMRHTRTNRDNEYRKPQAFHEITREEWWVRHRPGHGIEDKFGGRPTCRWCMNFHIERLDHRCHGCNWALYCSIECQQADWMRQGGHQSECSAEYTPSATV